MSAAAIRTSPRRPLLRSFVRLAVALVVVTLVGGFVAFVETLDRTETRPGIHADGIVALTGGADRISDALDLLVAGGADRLLISGVNRSTSAAELTRQVPEARHLLSCCIELGYAAANTIGNARETRLWIARHNIRSLIVVTSNYHMPRALAEIADAAPGVSLTPFAVVVDRPEGSDWWSDGQRVRLVLVEYFKYLAVLGRTHLYPGAPYREIAASRAPALLPQGG